MTQGNADFTEVTVFQSEEGKSAFFAVTAATTLAFFAMVGFEDSVNMAEETQDPARIFPKIMLTGLGITGTIYVLVSITAVALVPVGDLTNDDLPEALVQVVQAGAPGLPMDKIFPFIAMFAVANSALINMLMASRLLYGMAQQDVLPRSLGRVHPVRRTPYVSIAFTTLIAVGLITYVVLKLDEDAISLLGGTTSLVAAVRLHGRQHRGARAAPRPRRGPPLHRPYAAADHRRRAVRVHGGTVGARRGPDAAVQDRRLAARRRGRAVVDHLVPQPRCPGEEDRLPQRRGPRRLTAAQRTPAGPSRRPDAKVE
ncbi:MAG: APC family permease [Nocardioidaceae bacterium]